MHFSNGCHRKKTPTLSLAVPLFHAMTATWVKQAEEMPEVYSIIQAGLEKLESYRVRMDLVPAYVLAMGKHYTRLYVIITNFLLY